MKVFPIFTTAGLSIWQSACRPGQKPRFGPRDFSTLPAPLRRWLVTASLSGAAISGWSTAKGEWCVRSSVAVPIAGGPVGWALGGLAWWDGCVYHLLAECGDAIVSADIYYPSSQGWARWLGIWRIQIIITSSQEEGLSHSLSVFLRGQRPLKIVYSLEDGETAKFKDGILSYQIDGRTILFPLARWIDGLVEIHHVLTSDIGGKP